VPSRSSLFVKPWEVMAAQVGIFCVGNQQRTFVKNLDSRFLETCHL